MTTLGPREHEVLAFLCALAPCQRRQIDDALHFQGASSTLNRLEMKGYAQRTWGISFFEGDHWWPTTAGRQYLKEHPSVP